MDVERTVPFILHRQAATEARMAKMAQFHVKFRADMEELRKRQGATEKLINACAKAGQAQIEMHTARLDGLEGPLEVQEREFRAFLDRFDAFLRRAGNGHGA